MKIYKGIYSDGQAHVTVDGKPLPMKRFLYDNRVVPFSWGEDYRGADRLALSLLGNCLEIHAAEMLLHDFANNIVKKLDDEWEITSADIEKFCDHKCAIGYAVQNSSGSSKCVFLPVLFPPEIISDPNYRLKSKEVLAN